MKMYMHDFDKIHESAMSCMNDMNHWVYDNSYRRSWFTQILRDIMLHTTYLHLGIVLIYIRTGMYN